MSSSSDEDDDCSMFGFGRGSGSIALSKKATAKENSEWNAPTSASNKSGLANEIPLPKPLPPKKNSLTPADKLPTQSKIQQEVFTSPQKSDHSAMHSKVVDISSSEPAPFPPSANPPSPTNSTIHAVSSASKNAVAQNIVPTNAPLVQQDHYKPPLHSDSMQQHIATQPSPPQQQTYVQPSPPQQQMCAQPTQQQQLPMQPPQQQFVMQQQQPLPFLQYASSQPSYQVQSFPVQQPIQSVPMQQITFLPAQQQVPPPLIFNAQTGQWQIVGQQTVLNQQTQSSSMPQFQQNQPLHFEPSKPISSSMSLPSNQSAECHVQQQVYAQNPHRNIVGREDSHTVNPVSSLDLISKETKSIETGESDSPELDQPLVWGLTGSSLSLSGISIGSRNKDIREAAEMAESLTKTERERKIREFEKEFSL